MARVDSASSTAPQPSCLPSSVKGPPIAQQPRPIALTSGPASPSFLAEVAISMLLIQSLVWFDLTLGPGWYPPKEPIPPTLVSPFHGPVMSQQLPSLATIGMTLDSTSSAPRSTVPLRASRIHSSFPC